MKMSKMNHEPMWVHALRDVAPDWLRAAKQATSEAEAFFPFVSSSRVIDSIPHSVSVTLYTRFDSEVFGSGASSITVIKRILSRADICLYGLPSLHAKILVIDRRFVSIGSQNLTVRGSTNLEATMINWSERDSEDIIKDMQQWKERAFRITPEMVATMEAALPRLRRLYRAFLEQVHEIDSLVSFHVKEVEQQRAIAAKEEERQLQIREIARSEFLSSLSFLQQKIMAFCPNNVVSEALARDLVRNSAEVINSFGRGPASAPAAAQSVFYVPYLGWCWNVGAARDSNKFVIDRATIECKKIIMEACNRICNGEYETTSVLKERLKNVVSSCVANTVDEWYAGDYSKDNVHIRFWGQGINLDSFVERILAYLPVRDVLSKQGRLWSLNNRKG